MGATRVLAIEIKFLCPACHSKLRTEVEHAGVKTACTVCQSMLTVPSPFVTRVLSPVEKETEDGPVGVPGTPASILTADEVAFLTGEV